MELNEIERLYKNGYDFDFILSRIIMCNLSYDNDLLTKERDLINDYHVMMCVMFKNFELLQRIFYLRPELFDVFILRQAIQNNFTECVEFLVNNNVYDIRIIGFCIDLCEKLKLTNMADFLIKYKDNNECQKCLLKYNTKKLCNIDFSRINDFVVLHENLKSINKSLKDIVKKYSGKSYKNNLCSRGKCKNYSKYLERDDMCSRSSSLGIRSKCSSLSSSSSLSSFSSSSSCSCSSSCDCERCDYESSLYFCNDKCCNDGEHCGNNDKCCNDGEHCGNNDKCCNDGEHCGNESFCMLNR